jgi:hypothetical protein
MRYIVLLSIYLCTRRLDVTYTEKPTTASAATQLLPERRQARLMEIQRPDVHGGPGWPWLDRANNRLEFRAVDMTFFVRGVQ